MQWKPGHQIPHQFFRNPGGTTYFAVTLAVDTVLTDYECWHSHLLPNGYLVFHDIYPNPNDGGQAPLKVYHQALASGRFKAFAMTGSLGVLQRV
jgi:hypothetical protein